MAIYKTTIPLADDDQSISQADIQQNFEKANSDFEFDHVAFTNTGSNVGMHNSITTPAQAVDPTTVAEIPKFYSKSVITAPGTPQVLQFSRGESDATPTPLTNIYGNLTTITSTPVTLIDLSGITSCVFEITVDNGSTVLQKNTILYYGTAIESQKCAGLITSFTYTLSGNIIQITDTASQLVSYTINFLRLE